MTREEELQAEVDRLQHIVRELTAVDQAQKIKAALGVTPICSRIIACLLVAPPSGRSHEAIYAYAMQHPNGDGPEIEGLKVHLANARRRLRALGAPGDIESVWGWGYRLSADLRNWLQARLHPGMVVSA